MKRKQSTQNQVKPFYAGQLFSEGDVNYRIVEGNRCDGDLALECSMGGGRWVRIPISLGLIFFQLKAQVEENNYGNKGKIMRGEGRQKLVNAYWDTLDHGWEIEADKIEQQSKGAARRRLKMSQGLWG